MHAHVLPASALYNKAQLTLCNFGSVCHPATLTGKESSWTFQILKMFSGFRVWEIQSILAFRGLPTEAWNIKAKSYDSSNFAYLANCCRNSWISLTMFRLFVPPDCPLSTDSVYKLQHLHPLSIVCAQKII
jgi:hypothetical protein